MRKHLSCACSVGKILSRAKVKESDKGAGVVNFHQDTHKELLICHLNSFLLEVFDLFIRQLSLVKNGSSSKTGVFYPDNQLYIPYKIFIFFIIFLIILNFYMVCSGKRMPLFL